MKTLVLSPHYDDAIWSAGAHLACQARTGGGVTIATVCSRPPAPQLLTAHDAKCGSWPDSNTAVAVRRRENIRACAVLGDGVGDVDGDFSDEQYGAAATEQDIAIWLEPLARNAETLIAPLGIGHPDHRRIGSAARWVARRLRRPLIVYEDLPGRVWDPPEPVHLIDDLLERGWRQEAPGIDAPSDDDYAIKAAAAECYTSQIDPPIRAVLTVPERLWRLTWSDPT